MAQEAKDPQKEKKTKKKNRNAKDTHVLISFQNTSFTPPFRLPTVHRLFPIFPLMSVPLIPAVICWSFDRFPKVKSDKISSSHHSLCSAFACLGMKKNWEGVVRCFRERRAEKNEANDNGRVEVKRSTVVGREWWWNLKNR